MDNEYFADVTLLWVSRFDYAHQWRLKEHIHKEFYQLIYSIRGECTLVIDGSSFPMQSSSLVFIHPNHPHGIEKVGKEGLKTLDVKFTVNNERLREKLHAMPCFYPTCDESIRDDLERIRMEGDEQDYEYVPFSQLILGLVLLKLLRQTLPIKKKSIPSANYYYNESSSPIVTKIIAFIENKYASDITTEDFEKHLNYSYRFLSKLSKIEIGLTPVELLELQRINIAKEKLALTNELLKNIAELVGFPNIHHFSRSFKRVVGIPPGEYRKNFQNGIRKDILFSRDFKNELNIEIAGNSSEFDKL